MEPALVLSFHCYTEEGVKACKVTLHLVVVPIQQRWSRGGSTEAVSGAGACAGISARAMNCCNMVCG